MRFYEAWSSFTGPFLKKQENTSVRHIYDTWETKSIHWWKILKGLRGLLESLFLADPLLNPGIVAGRRHKFQVQDSLTQGAPPGPEFPNLTLKWIITFPNRILLSWSRTHKEPLMSPLLAHWEQKCERSHVGLDFISNDLKATSNQGMLRSFPQNPRKYLERGKS